VKICLEERIPGAKHFIWAEALWLPKWDIHTFPSDLQYNNILTFIPKIEMVRSFLGVKMLVTSWTRPDLYNELIGGSKDSSHKKALALDFKTKEYSASDIRDALKPELKRIGIRQENIQGHWVHIDGKAPKNNRRFFKP